MSAISRIHWKFDEHFRNLSSTLTRETNEIASDNCCTVFDHWDRFFPSFHPSILLSGTLNEVVIESRVYPFLNRKGFPFNQSRLFLSFFLTHINKNCKTVFIEKSISWSRWFHECFTSFEIYHHRNRNKGNIFNSRFCAINYLLTMPGKSINQRFIALLRFILRRNRWGIIIQENGIVRNFNIEEGKKFWKSWGRRKEKKKIYIYIFSIFLFFFFLTKRFLNINGFTIIIVGFYYGLW